MRRGSRGFSHLPGGGNRPVTKLHIALVSVLLVGIFVVAPLLVWLNGWLAKRRTLVDVSASPRLARAEAALRDACKITYDRPGLESGKGTRYLDVVFVEPCGNGGLQRYRAPHSWPTIGHTSPPFRLERDSRAEPWRIHGWAKPDEIAKALEEASPTLHGGPM